MKTLWKIALSSFALIAILLSLPIAPARAGDVVGKITAGYQGWFACPGDGAPINIWWHYSPNSQQPNNGNHSLHCWPDSREFTNTYQTGFANLGNQTPAKLFSSWDQQTIDTHFLWMQQYGVDTAALQRFNPTGGEGSTRNGVTLKVKQSAETYGRKFYIMYDVSGWTNMESEMEADWTNTIKNTMHLTDSPAYAKENNKPVVCIWGMGFNDGNHPWDAATCTRVINWFKGQGCYVIGGVPTYWRTENNDSRPGFLSTYHSFNMLSPWMVGRIGNANDSDNLRANVNNGDVTDCNANGVAYQPCVLPGDTGQRAHGDFMWRQFGNMYQAGASAIYISMFDEFGEGNQIAKTAEDSSMMPVGAPGMFTLDQDGVHCSSDYYLRLTADGGKMMKHLIPFTWTRPTLPITAPAGRQLLPGTTVYLQARINAKYVCAENAGANALIANRPAGGSWETFTVVDAGSGNIALRSNVNGMYVCAENAGANPLIANRSSVGSWETFTEVSEGNGYIAIRATVNGKYVTADALAANPLIASATTAGAWELFSVVRL